MSPQTVREPTLQRDIVKIKGRPCRADASTRSHPFVALHHSAGARGGDVSSTQLSGPFGDLASPGWHQRRWARRSIAGCDRPLPPRASRGRVTVPGYGDDIPRAEPLAAHHPGDPNEGRQAGCDRLPRPGRAHLASPARRGRPGRERLQSGPARACHLAGRARRLCGRRCGCCPHRTCTRR